MALNLTSRTKRIATATTLAAALAVPAEGLRLAAYRDPVGLPTICFGATRNVQMGDEATPAQCQEMLTRDMLDAIETVERCRPGLPVEVLAAFADATYNMGPKIACDARSSTAARLLLKEKYDEACRELPRWNKARVQGLLIPLPGLTKRRQQEMELCLQGA